MMQTDGEAAPARRTIKDKLNYLFSMVRPVVERDGSRLPYSQTKPYTNVELASALGKSAAYIGQLRKGTADNPSMEVLEGIAEFFDVSAMYFLSNPEEARCAEQLLEIAVWRRQFEDGEATEPPHGSNLCTGRTQDVLAIFTRASGLQTKEGRELVLSALDHARRMESLRVVVESHGTS